MKRLALVALLTLATVAQEQTSIRIGDGSGGDVDGDLVPRMRLGEARSAIVSRSGDIALLLSDDALLMQFTDAGRERIDGWLRYNGVDLAALAPWLEPGFDPAEDIATEMAEDAVYAPYLERQDAELRDLRASEAVMLAADFPYGAVPGLSNEMVERLAAARPGTLAAAGRVPGITPAALSALLVHARRHARQAA